MEQEIVQQKNKPSLLGMIWSPGEQFDRIRNNPRIWGALIIVTVIFTIGMGLVLDSIDFAEVAGIEISPSAELMLVLISAVFTGIFSTVMGILFSTLVYFIIIKVAKKDATFRQLLSMTAYIFFISALGLLLNAGVQTLIGGNPEIYITSLGGLFNSTSPVLASFEIFSIWQMILTAMGLNKVGQLSKGLSWTIVIIIFLISLGMAFISSFIAGVAGV